MDALRRTNLRRVDDALTLYRDRLSEFVGTLEVSDYINLSLVNHAEELSEWLVATIDAFTAKLGDQVSTHVRTSDVLRAKLGEREKIRVAVDAFDNFGRSVSAGPARSAVADSAPDNGGSAADLRPEQAIA
jgi:hypothetical protein